MGKRDRLQEPIPKELLENADIELPKRNSGHFCNARLKSRRGYCRRMAGAGTEHTGSGRCRLHGGTGGRPIKHGFASTILQGPMGERMQYYLSEEGRAESWDLDLMMARFNALFEAAMADPDGPNVPVGYKILGEQAKVVQKHQAMQQKGALKLDEWRTYGIQLNHLWVKGIKKLVMKEFGVGHSRGKEFAEDVRDHVQDSFEAFIHSKKRLK